MTATYILAALALLLLAGAVALVGISIVQRAARQQRSRESMESRLNVRDAQGRRDAGEPATADAVAEGWRSQLASQSAQWGKRAASGKLGEQLLSKEDRVLMAQCGMNAESQRYAFALWRVGLAAALPLIAIFAFPTDGFMQNLAGGFIGVALGIMLPKWMLRRRASARREQAAAELPLLIDLLRLLQGVGLSLDQTLHTVVKEFNVVLPVLSQELSIANGQYERGRTREQALGRISTLFGDDNISTLVRMLVQVDRHGGAVQEPLQRFGERLREQRKLELKAKVGRLTVKMTGVMIVTLLPALIIVTGGAGFLAIFQGLSRLG